MADLILKNKEELLFSLNLKKQNELLLNALKNLEVNHSYEPIKNGAEVDLTTPIGKTALMSAVEDYNIYMIEFLLENGANPNLVDHSGNNLLHYACRNVDYDLKLSNKKEITFINRILALCSSVNAVNKAGYSPLSYAAMNNKINTMDILFKHGATVEFYDQSSILKSALFQIGNKEILHLDSMRKLISLGADVNYLSLNNQKTGQQSILMSAARSNNNVVKFLIKAGANLNVQSDIGTALINAILFKRYSAAKTLIRSGADVNLTGIVTKKSALYYAVQRGDEELVALLIEHGAHFIKDNLSTEKSESHLALAYCLLLKNKALTAMVEFKILKDALHQMDPVKGEEVVSINPRRARF